MKPKNIVWPKVQWTLEIRSWKIEENLEIEDTKILKNAIPQYITLFVLKISLLEKHNEAKK